MISFSDRNIEMYQKHKQGTTFSDLGLEYDLTNERIRQIVTAMQCIISKLFPIVQSNNIGPNSEAWKRLTETDIDFIQRLRGRIARTM